MKFKSQRLNNPHSHTAGYITLQNTCPSLLDLFKFASHITEKLIQHDCVNENSYPEYIYPEET